ncbi:TonB-linked SusC/RagA family outer membrane protein [Jejuia pallidilutea]|uniref:TonB-linked SusC/RagA family outer membrane protein n=1 Tax=Jejuia pallidilutea TaxID=504487 RepID=A0A362X1K7_9FLAO|nr:TonB-dependent receptor [Jejuia pallidilutea]PQV50233.1 TonB-linked SusC/RagA family outer membrane protein [Jejuia pallidilutea]
MKIKLNSRFFFFRKKLPITLINALFFMCITSAFGASVTSKTIITIENSTQQSEITGTVTDINGQPLAGATVLEKGTLNGAQTDFDGKFSITPSNANATLVVSYIGFKTKEVAINNQTNIAITLEEDVSALDEVVVVGYGTQKKVNVTAAVSEIGTEVFENRPTANAARSLQGTVPGLIISNTTSGGEPGADSAINIRGFVTSQGGVIQDNPPLVLIDGIRMSINDINPEDIESVSVLKDAAAAAIYGSNASAGAILVTTKSGKNAKGKARISYRSNISFTQPTTYPKSASPIDFAYTINDARINNRQNPFHDETDLANIRANMANPGSAPSIVSNPTGNAWNYGAIGIEGTGATNWDDIIIKKWAQRTKHDLSISGGTEKVNYYVSAGAYDEDGLLTHGDESFQRYNLDAKFGAQVNKWLTIELYSKFLKSFTDFPTQDGRGSVIRNKTQVLDLLTKIKPTLPQFDPIYGEELITHQYYPFFKYQRFKTRNDQVILSPKFIVQATKDLKLNLELNYRRNNNFQETILLAHQQIVPNGLVDRRPQEQSSYSPTVSRTEYFSPNFFATYDKTINNHNFNLTAGFQSEVNNFYALAGSSPYLITNNVVSLNATLASPDQRSVSETKNHWATLGYFGRIRYNFKEKYLLEFTYRRDGSSRFAPEDRWVSAPSFSAGYNIAKEDFWPLESINTFKLRGSYGTLGSQQVAPIYGYLAPINTNGTTAFLFGGQQGNFSQTPGFAGESLTWETVKTTDIGFDLGAFNNKLTAAFSWYRVDTEGVIGPGLELPAVLGATPPLRNVGTVRVQGFDLEVTWRQQFGDFGYSIRGVLNDYQQTVTEFPNETNLLTSNFAGRDLGDIYGYETDGLFQSNEEATEYTDAVDQSFINGFAYEAGDLKYVDQNGDGVINNGDNTVENSGDLKVIGNSTPRYQYGFTLSVNYKNWDFNAFLQGVAKRDVNMVQGNSQGFRGPSNGPFHAFVWEGHLDYFRPEDTTNPLGPNLDAYFPKPYMNGGGRTNKNYRQNTSHFIQNGAYMRLKSLQIGYSIPKDVIKKLNIDNIRMYVTGENLFTVSDLMFFDPEQVRGSIDLLGSASSYPLSRIVSFGVNVSF